MSIFFYRSAELEIDGMVPEEKKDAEGARIRRLAPQLLAVLLLAAAGLKFLDLALIELNRHQLILPQFDVALIPTHDPRVTKRLASVFRYKHPPRITFTGDSRTRCGFDPEVVGRTLGVQPETCFNFGTGSQYRPVHPRGLPPLPARG